MKKRLYVLTLTICFCIMQIVLNSKELPSARASVVNRRISRTNTSTSEKNPSASGTTKFEVNTLASSGAEDKDSFVLAIMGDGFTKDEQATFNKEAQELSDHILETKPFSDAKKKTSIYAIDVISNESGAAMSPSSPLDTYFGCSFNCSGIERLLYYTKGNPQQVAKNHIPDYDFVMILVNSTKDGGAGGSVAVSSLNEAGDTLLHELGHSIGGLNDEYWYQGEEGPNMTQESDPQKVKWKEYIGKEGVGVYPYEGAGSAGWYRPSQNCKMCAVENDFCAVCKATLAKQIDLYTKKTASDGYTSHTSTDYGNGDYSDSGYGNDDYSNSDYGSDGYSDSVYGKDDYTNSDYGSDDSSKTGYGNDDNSNSDYGSNDIPKSSYGNDDNSNSGYGSNDISKSGYGNDDNSNSGYGSNDISKSGYDNDDNSNSGYGSNDISKSGYDNHDCDYHKDKASYSDKGNRSKNTIKKIFQWFGDLL